MEDVEFHFAIEGISGKGRDFLLETIKEAKMFMKAHTIDSTKTTWSDLYKVMTKNKSSIVLNIYCNGKILIRRKFNPKISSGYCI